MLNKDFFLKPTHPMQIRYEALRASYVDNLSSEEISKSFAYTVYSFKSLKRDSKDIKAEDIFKELKRGPKRPQERTISSRERIIELRKKNFSVVEIQEKLKHEGIKLSINHLSVLLRREGFTKLFRRTNRERLEALQQDKRYPEISDIKLFAERQEVSTTFGGVFLFLPLIRQLRLDELFGADGFRSTKAIPSISYLLSYLALKLLGKDRVCHIDDFGFDYGLGVFAGLNVLPKSASISGYTYRHSARVIRKLLNGFVKRLHLEGYIKGHNINLDFHVIPHYGDGSVLEGHWVPTRGKRMKSVLSFFAQDLDTTFLCFSDGEIRKDTQSDEILEFIKFYENSTGLLPERLVFDSKLTTYRNLDKLNQRGILFITLKRRGKNFLEEISNITKWNKVTLDNVKRKYRNLQYREKEIPLKDYEGSVREIIVQGAGRELPMCLISNDLKSSVKEILTIYSHRWRIENNIQENVDFFNLNALASPVVVKVDFDIAMTLIANTLYKILAQKTKWFKNATPKTISRNFIDIKTNISIKGDIIKVKLGLKNYNPVIMEWVNSLEEIKIPWWENRTMVFDFE
ncbi:MAG: transposase [Candidatus Scalinduaceae bacterium]